MLSFNQKMMWTVSLDVANKSIFKKMEYHESEKQKYNVRICERWVFRGKIVVQEREHVNMFWAEAASRLREALTWLIVAGLDIIFYKKVRYDVIQFSKLAYETIWYDTIW